MRARHPLIWSALLTALSCGGAPAPHPSPARTPTGKTAARSADVLAFTIKEGRTENRFFRAGQVAAHVLATSGDAPRIVFAFPAGNMGVGVWFDDAADLSIDGALEPVERPDAMRGVTATIRAHAPKLHVHRALLGSVRLLRHTARDGALDPRFANDVGPSRGGTPGTPLVLRRTTLDGGHHLELAVDAKDGSAARADKGDVTLVAGPSGDVVVRLTALSDEPPLTPVPPHDIVNEHAASDPRSLEVLSFLTYEEKLLAGSWQYLTYFGRDTLLSTRLLMPALRPVVVEAALGAVIERLSPDGEVAHEEDIGEWAVFENLDKSPRPTDLRQPLYDYKMVDDDFMLAAVLDAYLQTKQGAERADAFFARKTTRGATFAEAVRKNLDRVLAQAAPFAAKPGHESLIHIGDKHEVGNWRDSNEGLGRGRIPYDVNVALVPAALHGAERLYAMPALGKDAAKAARAAELARAWSKAEPLFRVQVDAEEAKKRVSAYAKEQSLDARDALAAIRGPVSFPGVSLDAHGVPVPIENSDDGFVLEFGDPSPEWLGAATSRITSPFPAGLRTPVGVVVANPAYATDPQLRGIFTRDHYHGTVVWSWQQALLLSGVRRQLARKDLPAETHRALEDAERSLVATIEAARSMRTSELWSFSVDAGGWHVVPFGQGKGHHTEANAAQLWSTVYLALDGR